MVSLADIENIYKKRRHDKQMRQECVKVNKFIIQLSICLLRSVSQFRTHESLSRLVICLSPLQNRRKMISSSMEGV